MSMVILLILVVFLSLSPISQAAGTRTEEAIAICTMWTLLASFLVFLCRQVLQWWRLVLPKLKI